jgi:hypothetical protein
MGGPEADVVGTAVETDEVSPRFPASLSIRLSPPNPSQRGPRIPCSSTIADSRIDLSLAVEHINPGIEAPLAGRDRSHGFRLASSHSLARPQHVFRHDAWKLDIDEFSGTALRLLVGHPALRPATMSRLRPLFEISARTCKVRFSRSMSRQSILRSSPLRIPVINAVIISEHHNSLCLKPRQRPQP